MREPVDQRSGSSAGSGVLEQAGSVLGGAAHGAGSMLKTGVLRRDRVSEADYEARLDVCRQCPGGHAQFKSDGRLHTCGPMLESMKGSGASGGEGQGTCGCVLSKKARDAAEACPFGYWPTLEQTRLERVSLPVLNARAGKLAPVAQVDEAAVPQTRLTRWRSRLMEPMQRLRARHQLWASQSAPSDPSRRRFFQRAAGGLAGLMGLMAGWPRAWAGDEEECYVDADPCGNAPPGGLKCSEVEGEQIGQTFVLGDDCYTLTGVTRKEPENLIAYGAPVDDCHAKECKDCWYKFTATYECEDDTSGDWTASSPEETDQKCVAPPEDNPGPTEWTLDAGDSHDCKFVYHKWVKTGQDCEDGGGCTNAPSAPTLPSTPDCGECVWAPCTCPCWPPPCPAGSSTTLEDEYLRSWQYVCIEDGECKGSGSNSMNTWTDPMSPQCEWMDDISIGALALAGGCQWEAEGGGDPANNCFGVNIFYKPTGVTPEGAYKGDRACDPNSHIGVHSMSVSENV